MIDFPTNPAVDTVVTAPNGIAWKWNGTTWLMLGAGGGGVPPVVAGGGLTLSGNTMDAVAGNSTLVVNADSMNVNPNLNLTTLSTTGNVNVATKVDFPETAGTKLDLYDNRYTIGIETSAMRYDADGYHNFYANGTRRAYVDNQGVVSNGFITQSGTVVLGPSYENVYSISFGYAFSQAPIITFANGDHNAVPTGMLFNIITRYPSYVTVRIYNHAGDWIAGVVRIDWIAHGLR